jgi:hypothetical protein
VAGAVGAICVVFATKAAFASANAQHLPPSTFKVYIAPIIFGLAPVINVLVAIIWHPKSGQWLNFGFEMPGWKLIVGIVLVGAGAALVLFSKEEAEAKKPKTAQVAPKTIAKAEPAP